MEYGRLIFKFSKTLIQESIFKKKLEKCWGIFTPLFQNKAVKWGDSSKD